MSVSQGVERGAAVVNGDVDKPFLLLVVLQHQVRAVVAVNGHRRGKAVTPSFHQTDSRNLEEVQLFVQQFMSGNFLVQPTNSPNNVYVASFVDKVALESGVQNIGKVGFYEAPENCVWKCQSLKGNTCLLSVCTTAYGMSPKVKVQNFACSDVT